MINSISREDTCHSRPYEYPLCKRSKVGSTSLNTKTRSAGGSSSFHVGKKSCYHPEKWQIRADLEDEFDTRVIGKISQ